VLRTRVIPALLLRNESLVKTVRFSGFTYVGDPANTVRIFNELEVDELIFLDITATCDGRSPNLKVLADIANECFMPISYGGGVRSLEQASAILALGVEKVVLNTHAVRRPELITEIATKFGSQAVVVSIDVKAGLLGPRTVHTDAGRVNARLDPVDWARKAEERGAGEILLTAVDREGTWGGFDLELVSSVSRAVSVPVIAHGGAGSLEHIRAAVKEAGASAVALGSMVVFQKRGMGVLVHFPDPTLLEHLLA
jgi:cyclase